MPEVRRAIIFGIQPHIRTLFCRQLSRKGFVVNGCETIEQLKVLVQDGFPDFIAIDDLVANFCRDSFLDQLRELGWDAATTETVFLSDHRESRNSGMPPTAFATVPIVGWTDRLKRVFRG